MAGVPVEGWGWSQHHPFPFSFASMIGRPGGTATVPTPAERPLRMATTKPPMAARVFDRLIDATNHQQDSDRSFVCGFLIEDVRLSRRVKGINQHQTSRHGVILAKSGLLPPSAGDWSLGSPKPSPHPKPSPLFPLDLSAAIIKPDFSCKDLNSGMNVDYRTIPQKDLAKFVLSEGGWSKLLCIGEKVRRLVDVALVFVGKELQSSAISRNEHEDPTLLHLIKESNNMEDSLITGFTDHYGHGLERKNVVVLESCAVDGYQKLANMQSAHVTQGMLNKGEALSELINYVEQSGSSYKVLYASDPHRSMQYPSYKALSRFLVEGGNGSDNSTTYCDGGCHIKSSLLERLLVAKLQMRRQELTQTTPDQSVDDEAVYYKVAGDCPKGCVYSLRSLWRKKRRYVDPDASTSQMLAQRGMSNFMILSNGSETELLYSVSDPLLIRDGSKTEYNNFVSDPLLIRDGSETECNYNCTL
ncbi:hypothetical protein Syun_029750 [Stephania yunnanensis]|uniref:Uncharacterized protein n=1 Tax=Stephania yunnanensis TaxID=152371 RepID=A0AAP0E676_9MAGN